MDSSTHYREDNEKPKEVNSRGPDNVEGSRGYNRELILSLFRDAKLMYRIVDGQMRNDEESAKPRTPRLGYMGHLTLISEDVLTSLERYPASLREEIMQYAPKGSADGKGSWDEYVTGRYRETKVRDTRLLGGGKPAVGLGGIAAGGLASGEGTGKWKVDEEELGTVRTSAVSGASAKNGDDEMRGEFRRSTTGKPRREGSADFGVAPVAMDDDEDFDSNHTVRVLAFFPISITDIPLFYS